MHILPLHRCNHRLLMCVVCYSPVPRGDLCAHGRKKHWRFARTVGWRPRVCYLCPKAFKNKTELKEHFGKEHSKEERIT